MPQSITGLAPAPLSVTALLLNLAIGMVLSLILAWHYVRFGSTLSNRGSLARIFPFVTLTTILVISVVKSSLALSLGLVGALSIVRFRTPIKEPEELAYLFLCIAMGLALGADQRIAALTGAPLIMVLVAVSKYSRGRRKEENLFLNVTLPGGADGDDWFGRITAVLADRVELADVRRMDVADDTLHVTYLVRCRRQEDLIGAMDGLREAFPGASITFVEQQNFLGG
jgi:hypothetical protein